MVHVHCSFLVSVFWLIASGLAHAQSTPKEVIVVDVVLGEPALDANRLRSAVGSELGAEAVAPEDPRASHASGTLRVSIDHASHSLVVAYQGHTEPLVRKVDLPGDAQATQRAAVLLAGNLARNEAGELAADLRKSKATAPALPGASVSEESPPAEEKATHDVDALGVALAHEIRAARPLEMDADFLVGLGTGALGAAATWMLSELATRPSLVTEGPWYLFGAGSLSLGVSGLLRPGDFRELNEYHARNRASALPAATVLEDVEQAWLRSARAERRKRRFLGWFEIVGGGLVAAGATTVLVIDSQNANRLFATPFVVFGVSGAADLALGIYWVATDGPLESAMHAYERSVGRVLAPAQTVSLLPVFVPTSGGGVFGVGGRF